MTKADTESIWKTSLDATRFADVGVRIAELLNIEFNENATTQVTSTAILPLLEQISEEIVIDLFAGAKGVGAALPWDFIASNFGDSITRIIWRWRTEIKEIKKIVNRSKTIEIVTRTL